MLSCFATHGEAAGSVGARLQAALHVFANT